MKQYARVASGGTFDHFHKGHKAFIDYQLEVSEYVHIGITSDIYVEGVKDGSFESFESRKEQVWGYIKSKNSTERVQILPIDDVYIPALWDFYTFDALIVTKDSQRGAAQINEDRVKKGKAPYEIITVPLVPAEDGEPISSRRIREGIISREGKVYFNPEWKEKTLLLPEQLRETVAKPFGEMIDREDLESLDTAKLITVGDVTTEMFLKKHIEPQIAVIDLKVQRQPLSYGANHYQFGKNRQKFSVKNPPARLTPESFQIAEAAIKSEEKSVILVDGEEDLLALLFAVTTPLGYHIFYGQPNLGLVCIFVTEDKKNEAYSLLSSFEIAP